VTEMKTVPGKTADPLYKTRLLVTSPEIL